MNSTADVSTHPDGEKIKRLLLWRPWAAWNMASKPQHGTLQLCWAVCWSLSNAAWMAFQVGATLTLVFTPIDFLLYGHMTWATQQALEMTPLAFLISGIAIGCAQGIRKLDGSLNRRK
ncbi:hypothetical protein HAP94_14450 [Acidithiobacillus ferrivorans]|nr:hypothetical protein [Acidithiobacillus ferrivorans]